MDMNYVRESVEVVSIVITHVPENFQTVDVLTKNLTQKILLIKGSILCHQCLKIEGVC